MRRSRLLTGVNPSPTPGRAAAAPERILGWDLLRGCCAYAILGFHLMTWQKVADVHTLGLYGVYLFFVLSGASLALNYHTQFSQRPGAGVYLRFMFVRYMRLLPLFALMVVISLAWKLRSDGLTAELALRTLLNLSFTFGLFDPLLSSMVIGGWSLGIEFVFYLLFPLFIRLLGGPAWRRWLVFAALIVLQFAWIEATIARGSLSPALLSAYHQVPAFAAYFFGGCMIGRWYLRRPPAHSIGPGACLAGIALAGALLVGLNTADAAAVLRGWRGAILTSLCFALVWWTGLARLGPRLARWSAFMGDVTYGVYLIHPLLYFGLAFAVAPRVGWLDVTAGPSITALALGATILLLTSALAWVSERNFEQPVRRWSVRRSGARP